MLKEITFFFAIYIVPCTRFTEPEWFVRKSIVTDPIDDEASRLHCYACRYTLV
jgi:hypothetical protein